MSLDVWLIEKECPTCGRGQVIFESNITHNLNKMADEAGIYGIVWRPEENGIKKAGQLVEPLRRAISKMKEDPDRFKKHNASNGWGLYEHFLPWLEKYLAACELAPNTTVHVSR